MRLRVILILLLTITATAVAQQRVGMAYYNVENLYDTIPSRFYDDEAYTPSGRLHWSHERYQRKVESVASVIDSMAMPIVILYGVENEQVVRDIALSCRGDYAYIHKSLNSLDGIEFALLYFADIFFPQQITTDNRSLCIRGSIFDKDYTLIMSRRSDDVPRIVDEIQTTHPETHLMLFGKSSHKALSKTTLRDIFIEERRKGRGSRCTSRGWYIPESVWVDSRLSTECGIYANSNLFDEILSRPKPTFSGSEYVGGNSSHLPLYLYVWLPKQ